MTAGVEVEEVNLENLRKLKKQTRTWLLKFKHLEECCVFEEGPWSSWIFLIRPGRQGTLLERGHADTSYAL